jgi:hypothetical protein
LSGTAKFNHDRIVTGRSLALNFLGNDAHEFIPQFLIHVLPTGFHRASAINQRMMRLFNALNFRLLFFHKQYHNAASVPSFAGCAAGLAAAL